MMQVVAKQSDCDFLQGTRGRCDLSDHVGAPDVGIDHSLQATNLALDLPQPPLVVILA
jgi:hypothetical protein